MPFWVTAYLLHPHIYIPGTPFQHRGCDLFSLHDTEMWLSITWLIADLLGISDALGYRPKGVHRPEVALTMPR